VRPRLALLLLLVLVACGQETAGIGAGASAVLDPQVQQVRASATAGDRAGVAAKLVELRRTVADLRQRGELSEAGADRVLAAAADVEAQLGPVAPITPTTRLSPTTSGPRDTRETTRTTKKADKEKDDDDD
jgi:hypothetical protein